MQAPIAEQSSIWDRLSAGYDRQLWLERAPIRRLLDLAAPRPGDRLLDVGTGTGALLRELAREPEPPEHAVGVDPSLAMLSRVPPLPAKWELRRAGGSALPFPDDAFDLVTASYVLHLLSHADRSAMLGEIARVLAPGGRLAVLTPAIPAHGPLRAVALVLDRLARACPRRCVGLRALDPRGDLDTAGFELLGARTSLRGYPSVCVLARHRSASRPAALTPAGGSSAVR